MERYILQQQISDLILKDNGCSVHYEWEIQDGPIFHLEVITFNPKHKTAFKAFEFDGESKIVILNELKDIIVKKTIRTEAKNYTIEWIYTGDKYDGPNNSHFSARNIYELLDKFYYEKDKDYFLILKIVLNPSS